MLSVGGGRGRGSRSPGQVIYSGTYNRNKHGGTGAPYIDVNQQRNRASRDDSPCSSEAPLASPRTPMHKKGSQTKGGLHSFTAQHKEMVNFLHESVGVLRNVTKTEKNYFMVFNDFASKADPLKPNFSLKAWDKTLADLRESAVAKDKHVVIFKVENSNVPRDFPAVNLDEMYKERLLLSANIDPLLVQPRC